jgi:hypothetical protein
MRAYKGSRGIDLLLLLPWRFTGTKEKKERKKNTQQLPSTEPSTRSCSAKPEQGRARA